MSLVIALEAAGGVVLAADTRVISTVGGMNYQQNDFSKARVFGQNCAVGVTGDVTLMLDFLLDAASNNLSFDAKRTPKETIDALAEHFRSLYRRKFGDKKFEKLLETKEGEPQTTITFAGHGMYGGGEESFIYSMSPEGLFGAKPKARFEVCGQAFHGGCYYLSRFYQQDLELRAAAFLAYFCICEVATLDAAVGTPVEIFTVKDGVATPISEKGLKEFGEQHQRAYEQMQGWFQSLGNN